jgi:hypothetical protein
MHTAYTTDPEKSQTTSPRHGSFRMPADAMRRNIAPTPANSGTERLPTQNALYS